MYARAEDARLLALAEAPDDSALPPLTSPADSDDLGELSELQILAPVLPKKIVAIGLNYQDHIEETGLSAPERPLIFAKFPSSVVGPYDPIEIDHDLTVRVDWEVELGVVVGKTMRNVPGTSALEHVFGYVTANDVSARDVQFADEQWVRGKSMDTFCPIGPAIVTADEIPNPQTLALSTKVNGALLQDSTTELMIFGVAELLEFCSRNFTLEPGDLILTGTPWGCGEYSNPRRCLAVGDILETEVDGIGVLRNPVVASRQKSY